MKSPNPLRVDLLRDSLVESQHDVLAVVCDQRGEVIHAWGDFKHLIFPRSTIKPLQALPFVESGAVESFGLDDRMIALACASHRGEKLHFEILQEWSRKIDISESCLICGGHLPFDEESQKDFIKNEKLLTPFCHNCAGKHMGILSLCKQKKYSSSGYGQMSHPAQQEIRNTLSQATQFDHEKAHQGVDGCGIPTYAVPLESLARGLSVFLQLDLPEERKKACHRILDAWGRYPELVSGSNGFLSRTARATQGRVLLKNGAEGTLCGLAVNKQFSFILKALDGAPRAAEASALWILEKLGALSEGEFESLKPLALPALSNSRREIVGFVRVNEK
jgi:L-asparaginase II